MKRLLQTTTLFLLVANAFCQKGTVIEIRSLEYVWDRTIADNRIVLMKDTIYQQILKNSFLKAFSERFGPDVSAVAVQVNKLPLLKFVPKFKTALSNTDTTKLYAFIQLFDESFAPNAYNSVWSARINVKYRLIKGAGNVTVEDKSASFNIIKRDAPLGQIAINRFSFYPAEFEYACDSIANAVVNGAANDGKEISLNAACAYTKDTCEMSHTIVECRFDKSRQSLSINGANTFTVEHDSVNTFQTGKKRHAGSNTALGLLTFFSNIDTEKKRSALYTADHAYHVGADTYHCLISYIDTKVADRRRVKDDEGMKSIEVGNYQPGWSEIKPDAVHFITHNGDTISSYKIRFRSVAESFTKMWNGKDMNTVDSLPAAFNNPPKLEIDMQGTIFDNRFLLTTSDEGKIKKVVFDEGKIFTIYTNSGIDGKICYNALDLRQLKMATLLSMVADKIRLIK